MNNKSFITEHYQLVKVENIIFTKWCKKYNILYMEAHLLLSIDESCGISEPTKLSESLLIPKQSITSLLDKLEKKEYIIRTHSAEDRRKINITLTENGKKIVDTIRHAFDLTEQEILKQLDIKEINHMLNTYKNIIEITEKKLLGLDDE